MTPTSQPAQPAQPAQPERSTTDAIMESGDQATMYHAGTNRFYRVIVQSVMTDADVLCEQNAC